MKVHHVHFLVLLAILAGGVWTFSYVRADHVLQLVTAAATISAYVLWGIIHHAVQKDLHPKIVIEYMLIGAIAVVLLLTLAL